MCLVIPKDVYKRQLSDRLTLNGEKISEALANLLCSVLFNPLLENGQFPRESFLQEQRQTLEMPDAEYNDKRIYAKQRCDCLLYTSRCV